MNYNVTYRQYLVKQNHIVHKNNYSCISFLNQGADTVVINSAIELLPGDGITFNEDPPVKIESQFEIRFQNNNVNKNLLVIESHYKPAI